MSCPLLPLSIVVGRLWNDSAGAHFRPSLIFSSIPFADGPVQRRPPACTHPMSNEHLRNRGLSLKAKGLLSQMLSLPEGWDHSLEGLSRINREGVDAIRTGIRELEEHGYLERRRLRDGSGRLVGTEYVVHERAVATGKPVATATP